MFTEHGRLSDATPSVKRRLLNPMFGRVPARIFAVSVDLKRHMVAEGFSHERVQVIHNGIELGIPPSLADRERARYLLGLSAHEFVCGTVGRLDPVKHLSMLVESHAAVQAVCPQMRLVIVGSGPERDGLEQLARRCGAADSIRFLGIRSDVRELLPAFDVYVNCSLHEGISLTIMEAMAAALPVIATRVGGNPEVVVDGETGLLVPSRSTGSLVSALSALMRDPERRRQMGEAGRWRVAHDFDIRRMVAQYHCEYERVVGLRARAATNNVARDALCVESAERSPSQAH
jgi:glycosyltransferase involved in cell wall biosynthesis